jgi:hypothetical protein
VIGGEDHPPPRLREVLGIDALDDSIVAFGFALLAGFEFSQMSRVERPSARQERSFADGHGALQVGAGCGVDSVECQKILAHGVVRYTLRVWTALTAQRAAPGESIVMSEGR